MRKWADSSIQEECLDSNQDETLLPCPLVKVISEDNLLSCDDDNTRITLDNHCLIKIEESDIRSAPSSTQKLKNELQFDSLKNDSLFDENERYTLLRTLHTNASTSSMATSLEGMYGENRISSLKYLCHILYTYFFLNEESSVFMDIGSGRGLPNIVVAVLIPMIQASGIEIDDTAYHLSLRTLSDLHILTMQQYMKKNRFIDSIFTSVQHNYSRIAFCNMDAALIDTFDPVTHVFSFDLAMPSYMVERFISLFNNSTTALVFVSFRRDLSEFDINAEPVCQIPMDMAGSSERHRATIYVRRTHLYKLIHTIPSFNLFSVKTFKHNVYKNGVRTMRLGSKSTQSTFSPVDTDSSYESYDVNFGNGASDCNSVCSANPCVSLDLARIIERAALSTRIRCSSCGKYTKVPQFMIIEKLESDSRYQILKHKDTCYRSAETKMPRRENKHVANSLKNANDNLLNQEFRRSKWRQKPNKKLTAANQTTLSNETSTDAPSALGVTPVLLEAPKFWACCDTCGKWRFLPGCTVKEYEELEAEPIWCCSKNKWNSAQASCSAPSSEPEKTEIVVETIRWAQCEVCHKWRALPNCTALEYQVVQQEKRWACWMNVWDPRRASCSAPEQSESDLSALPLPSNRLPSSEIPILSKQSDFASGEHHINQTICSNDVHISPASNKDDVSVIKDQLDMVLFDANPTETVSDIEGNAQLQPYSLRAKSQSNIKSPETRSRSWPKTETDKEFTNEMDLSTDIGGLSLTDTADPKASMNLQNFYGEGDADSHTNTEFFRHVFDSEDFQSLQNFFSDKKDLMLFLPSIIIERYKHVFLAYRPELVLCSYEPTSDVSKRVNICATQRSIAYKDFIDQRFIFTETQKEQYYYSPLLNSRRKKEFQIKTQFCMLKKLVMRCCLPLIHQIEWCHIELGMWLGESRSNERQQQILQKSSSAPKKRKRGPPPTTVMKTAIPTKNEYHRNLGHLLEMKWNTESEIQAQLIETKQWCMCPRPNNNELRPGIAYLPSGYYLVLNDKSVASLYLDELASNLVLKNDSALMN